MKHRYPNQRVAGLWFVWIGCVIVLSALLSPDSTIHGPHFALGFAIGFFSLYILPFAKRKLSYGKASSFQKRMSIFSFILMGSLIMISVKIVGSSDPRTLWICIFLAAGAYFLPFIPVHGRTMLFLSLLTILIAIMGLAIPSVPFLWLAFTDALLKMAFGLYLFSMKLQKFTLLRK